jgi:hypothetical protein
MNNARNIQYQIPVTIFSASYQIFQTKTLIGQKKKRFSSLGKLRVIYIDLEMLYPNMATKMLYHPPHLREKVLNPKT